MFLDISAGDKFLDMTPTESARKPKINKWDYIKVKICAAKETNNETKKQTNE